MQIHEREAETPVCIYKYLLQVYEGADPKILFPCPHNSVP